MVRRLVLGTVVVVLLAGCTGDGEDRVAGFEDEVAVVEDRSAQPEQRVEDLPRELDEDGTDPPAGAGSDSGAGPPSELDYADDVPRVVRPTIVFEGGDGATPPRSLAGGDYAVRVATAGDCLFTLVLQRSDGERRPLPVVQGSGVADGLLDGVPAGDWSVDDDSGPSCTWTVTLAPG